MRRADFIADALASCTDACVMWPFAVRKSSGYGAYCESRAAQKKNYDVHRYVCEKAHGAPQFSPAQAAHLCGNKLCCNPRHLSWKTPTANLEDAKRHGTLRGGGIYRQKLFARERAYIRDSEESLVALGAKFGMEPAYIGHVRREMRAAS